MRKFLAVITLTVMLLALISAPVFGLSFNAPKFFLKGPASAKVGDTVKISLNVEGEYAAHIINLTVNFDKTSFKYKGRSFGEAYADSVYQGGYGVCDVNKEGDGVGFGLMMLDEPATAEGVLVEISFEVLSTAASEANFTITVDQFASMPVGATNATDIPCSVEKLNIKLTGGTGPVVTPVPGPGDHSTPAPTSVPTGDPHYTGNPGTTAQPNATPDPNSTESAPNETPQPTQQNTGKATPEPGMTTVPAPTSSPVPMATDEAGNPVVPTDDAGNPVFPTDEAGNPIVPTDDAGNPIYPTDEAGNPIVPTDKAGDPAKSGNRALKTGLIIGGSVLAVGILALAAVLIIGKKRRIK
jgi:hypothetical protein